MVIGEHHHAWLRQIEAAGKRYRDTELERAHIEQERKSTGSMVVDTEEQIRARSDRLLATGEVPPQALIAVGRADPLGSLATMERIIGLANELQAVAFLPRGVRAAATVARISMSRNGREIPHGTGFLISPRLLLTNNHVLPDTDTARSVVIEFGAELTADLTPTASTRFRLDPDTFFVTDEHLDFTVVVVAAGVDGQTPGEVVGGWNRLIAQQGKIVVGEAMNIVGHPMGRLKEMSIRDNHLDLQLPDFLHYKTDTEPGNSGSPVFNDQWEVVALHHSGVPKTDAQGRALRHDGNVWQPGDGEDTVEWIANEGVRISVILRHLAGLDLDAGRRSILAELGPASGVTLSTVRESPAQPELSVAAPAAAEGIARGVGARPTAFGGSRHLLFLHGRGQQGRDPEHLRRTWTAGLNRGLTFAGLTPIEAVDVYFPFYGDVLTAAPLMPESLSAGVDGDSGSALYEQVVAEAAVRLGMPSELVSADVEAAEGLSGFASGVVGRLHRQLSWIAARSALDRVLLAQIFTDVAGYLDDARTRDRVLTTVMDALPPSGRLILVSHSLGTVVAMDLLTRMPAELEVELFVTAGSPLGLDAVHSKLLSGGPTRPDRAGHWLNVWYPGDPISIGCPLRTSWSGQVQELAVDNPRDRAHDIAEYLSHPAAARVIGEHLVAP